MSDKQQEQDEDQFTEDRFEDLNHFISEGVRTAKDTAKKTGIVLGTLTEESAQAAEQFRKKLGEQLGNTRNQFSERLADLRIGELSEEQQKEMLDTLDKAKAAASKQTAEEGGNPEAEKSEQES